ncbi:MAG: hypothetical protein HKP26_02145 [Nitrosopumilus sp.]|nr:hypothetical protein [Nitrosopumilus sp.]
MKIIWIMALMIVFFVTIDIEKSFAEDSPSHGECINTNNTKNFECDEAFRAQSMEIFSVVDSSIGIFEDPETKLTVVDLGSFYGIGGNGTIPDTVYVYRDDVLWKTTTKETGIAPSTSHSEWQIPQTFFFNELPGKYKLVLITNNTETLVFEFLVMQITEKFVKNNLSVNMSQNSVDDIGFIDSKLAPLKQIANGIHPEKITCKDGTSLVFKKTDNSPACVKPESIEKLIERRWMKI